VILDNYAAHKASKGPAKWLENRHERFTFHFNAPTSCSWLNAVRGVLLRHAHETAIENGRVPFNLRSPGFRSNRFPEKSTYAAENPSSGTADPR